MSRTMKLVKLSMRLQGCAFRKGLDVEKLRKAQAASSRMRPVAGVSYEERVIAGCPVDVAAPESCSGDAIIYYIHGGGFISGDPRHYRAFTSFLAKESGYPVYGIIYRLAPEHPFPAAPEDCYGVYRELVAANPHKKIYLVGESAGATLVIVTTLMARDRGIRLPDGVVAYAPGADFSGTIKRPVSRKKDLIIDSNGLQLLGEMYCPSQGTNPYASPCFADFRGFPPIRIVWDGDETLAEDGRLLTRKMKEAGVCVESKQWQDTFHTFEMLTTVLPEAKEEVLDSIRFLQNCQKLMRATLT